MSISYNPKDNSFPFLLVHKRGRLETEPNDINEIYTYRFKSNKSKQVYLVEVHHFRFNIFVVKYYLKSHRFSENKFNILTKLYEPRLVVNTCCMIMLDVYRKFNEASFGFIGSNTVTPSSSELRHNTKRYEFYKKLMSSYFSEEYFTHRKDDLNSAYLLLNNSVNACELQNDIHEMFRRNYSELV